MTVEVKAETAKAAEEPVKAAAAAEEPEKAVVVGGDKCEKDDESKPKMVEKSSSYREESHLLSDLKEHERKALNELKAKLEEAILGNTLFKKEERKETAKKTANEEEKKGEERAIGECETEAEKKAECEEDKKTEEGKATECEKQEETEEKEGQQPEADAEVYRDISIWGVPLLPSKGNEGTNVVLLKFLRAREFKVNDALEMLRETLRWRKEFKIDSILDEEFEADLAVAGYMSGTDRQGHPICYNIFGVLDQKEIYEKTLATEEKREQFLRWRVQLMERGVQKLDFKPDAINSLVQVNDLKNSPGPSKKEVRAAVNKAVASLGGYGVRTDGRYNPLAGVCSGYSHFDSPAYGMGLHMEQGLNAGLGGGSNFSGSAGYGRVMNPYFGSNHSRYNSPIGYSTSGSRGDSFFKSSSRNVWGNGGLTNSANNVSSASYFGSGNDGFGVFGSNGSNWGASPVGASIGGSSSGYIGGNAGFRVGENSYPMGAGAFGRNSATSLATKSSFSASSGSFEGSYGDFYRSGSVYADPTWQTAPSELDSSGAFGYAIGTSEDITGKDSEEYGYDLPNRQSNRGIAA